MQDIVELGQTARRAVETVGRGSARLQSSLIDRLVLALSLGQIIAHFGSLALPTP